MKRLACLLTALLVAAGAGGPGRAAEKREEKPRFKGVELYSWKDPTGRWTFALLTGTNRLKTAEEVQAPQNRIKGVADLKKALARLAVGEQVSWTHRIPGFEYPPAKTVREIERAARAVTVTLHGPPTNK